MLPIFLLTLRAEDPAVAALRALPAIHADVIYVGGKGPHPVATQFHVDADARRAVVRMVKPAESKSERQDISYWIEGRSLMAYDAVNDEWLSRPIQTGGSTLRRLWTTVGFGDDPILTSFDPATLAAFLGHMRDPKFGSLERSPNRLTMRGTAGTIRVSFDSRTQRLVSVDVTTKESMAAWTIRYRASGSTASARPKGALRVDNFVMGKALPTFDTRATELLVRRMLRAYRTMDRTEVTLDNGRRLYFGQNAIGERTTEGSWLHTRGTLRTTIGGAKSMPCKRSDVLDRLTENGWRVDPLIREMFARSTPFQGALIAGFTGKSIGAMRMDGADVTLVRLTGPLRRITLAIRRSDSLVVSQSSQLLDRAGNVMSSTETRYKYRTPVSPDEFDR